MTGMTASLLDLPWLPRPPADFRLRCRSAADGEAFAALAQYALDATGLTTLAKSIILGREQAAGLLPLTDFRLGVLSNATTDFLVPALTATGARYGLNLEVATAAFGQTVQALLEDGSAFLAQAPDAVLLALDHREFELSLDVLDSAEAAATVDRALDHIAMLRQAVHERSDASVIVQTLPRLPVSLFGSLDARLDGASARMVDAFNTRLAEQLAGSPDLLLDVAGLAQAVGLDLWHDDKMWHLAKLGFSQDALPLYADHAVRLVAALRGRARKCLVLDLDNTLWGGVIGDDGLEGIVLGQGDPAGEAYLAIQRTALALRARGVILAVCSKNDETNARQPFREHPEMLLTEDHIAAFQANWEDKASNLEAIAAALDIGLDSLVFLDDNPAERAQVREALPMVAVPEVGEDPSLFPRILLAGGYFESVGFSPEDRIRADQYQANSRRAALKVTSRNLDDYLASLDMEATLAPFAAVDRGRIAQLINKSNQFNLTTRRYTEAEIARLEEDPSVFTLQVRLADRFGDNGMIGVVIARPDGAAWEIDSWLMSCRVLGRRVEELVRDTLACHGKAAGARELRGVYVPTPKNGLVRDHYAKLGFENAGEGPDGETRWRLDLESWVPAELPLNPRGALAPGQ